MAKNIPETSLLSLPPEVRVKIYRDLLRSDSWICMKRGQPPGQGTLNGLHPAILATCRLIHNEAVVMLYEENSFIEALVDESNPNAKFIKRQRLLLPEPTDESATDEPWPILRSREREVMLRARWKKRRDTRLATSTLRSFY